MNAPESFKIAPQPGPQEQFLASPADIVIYGGSAGSGKTFSLLIEPIRHMGNPKFGGVIFRREAKQITNEGGLWDTAMDLFPLLGAKPKQSSPMGFTFLSGARISFDHLNQDTDVLNWQGSQIPYIGFDELTHFTRKQFFYMLSRNRSTCGVRPYIRATTNPDADSWVKELIGWWLDEETGYPIQERSGVVRYFARVDDALVWGSSKTNLAIEHAIDENEIKSLTFIPGKLTDNPALMSKDPGYLANLKALNRVERARLLEGNWNAKVVSGSMFRREEVGELIESLPHCTEFAKIVRGWDLAATEPSEDNPSPDATASVKMARMRDGTFLIMNVTQWRIKSADVRRRMTQIAENDDSSDEFPHARIRVPQDPGQAGKDQAEAFIHMLAGHSVVAIRPTGDEVARAEPFASQWQVGNVRVCRGPWNEKFFAELEGFPGSGHDDMVDAAADAFNELCHTADGVAVGVGESEVANESW